MKIPQQTLNVLHLQNDRIVLLGDILKRVDTNCHFLPEFYREKPTAYYEGQLQALYNCIEDTLFAYKQYNGYRVGRRELDQKYDIRNYSLPVNPGYKSELVHHTLLFNEPAKEQGAA